MNDLKRYYQTRLKEKNKTSRENSVTYSLENEVRVTVKYLPARCLEEIQSGAQTL